MVAAKTIISKIETELKKKAVTAVSINRLATFRWSPRAFSSRPVEREKLVALFEAARWSASAGNEQPWRFIIGQQPGESWMKILETLDEGNRIWNVTVPVLLLAAGSRISTYDGNENAYFRYDTGQAVAHLSLEAMRQGLHVHQMGGFSVEKAVKTFNIPVEYIPLVVIAVGYRDNPAILPEKLRQREIQERKRKELRELVFEDSFGTPSPLLTGF